MIFKHARLAACALVFVCAVATGQPTHQGKGNAAIAKQLRTVLLESMRDAESARIRGEFLSRAEEGQDPAIRSLCGEVNGKNAYGGYVGFTRFIVSTEGMMVMGPAEPVWLVWCTRPMAK